MKHPIYQYLPGLDPQPHLGVRLPERPKDFPMSDEEYLKRLNAFLEEKGRWDPKLGFEGNCSRLDALEEEFRLMVKKGSQRTLDESEKE